MIEQLRSAMDTALSDDPIILALVGLDRNGNPKVYEMTALKDEEPPFLVWSFVGGAGPTGHYHDDHAFENPDIQISGWGRDKNEAWQLHSTAEERLMTHDWSVELLPYNMLRIVRVNDPVPLQDPETSWIMVPSVYRASMAR